MAKPLLTINTAHIVIRSHTHEYGLIDSCLDFALTQLLQNHAFARFVLPVKSTAFGEQDWPKKKKEENGEKEGGKNDARSEPKKESIPEMSPEEKKLYDQLVQESDIQRNWQNNDAEPTEELKLLDRDAMEQLESCLSVEDQYVLRAWNIMSYSNITCRTTPDSWIPRSARLLRLAAHPLNAEPNTTELFEAGMITPTK